MTHQLKGWKSAQVGKAVTSLLKYIGKQQEGSADLLEDEEIIYVQIALKKSPTGPKKDKPVSIPLPHPLYTADGVEVCLFVKDHAGEGHKEAKKKLSKFEKNGGVAKVIGISKLRTKYESFEAKRQLCSLYDLFLADDRVLPMLPKLIGKSFFKKKKQPVPVDLRSKDWSAQIRKAVSCTHMFPATGSSISIRVARGTFTPQQVQQNVEAVVAEAVQHLPKKWSNVQGVFLKTAESVALPVYQSLPDAPAKITA